MELPVYIPYIDAILIIASIGVALIIFMSIGVLFKLWTWRAVQSMAYAFLAVILVLFVLSYLIGNLGTG